MQCKDCKNFIPMSKHKGYSKIGIGFCKDGGEDNSEFIECGIEDEINNLK